MAYARSPFARICDAFRKPDADPVDRSLCQLAQFNRGAFKSDAQAAFLRAKADRVGVLGRPVYALDYPVAPGLGGVDFIMDDSGVVEIRGHSYRGRDGYPVIGGCLWRRK